MLVRTTLFRSGEKLSPSYVYYAVIGMLEKLGAKQMLRVTGEIDEEHCLPLPELGRVYLWQNKLYVLYFPGKDNDIPFDVINGHTDVSLKQIIHGFGIAYSKFLAENADKISPEQIKSAVKIYPILEMNTVHWLLARVMRNHFVVAFEQEGKLCLRDSMRLPWIQYDVSYILAALPHEPENCVLVHTNWQRPVIDYWQCGHYVLAAVRRMLADEPEPECLPLTREMMIQNFWDYHRGSQTQDPSTLELRALLETKAEANRSKPGLSRSQSFPNFFSLEEKEKITYSTPQLPRRPR